MRHARLSWSPHKTRGCGVILVGASLVVAACGAASEPPRGDAPERPLLIGRSSPDAATAAPVPIASAADTAGRLAIPARDPRLSHRSPTMRALLTAEIEGLEEATGKAKAGSPARRALAESVAERYAELARQSEDEDAAKAAHRAAAKYYRVVAADYPQDPQVDEALYYLALETELGGDASNARAAYLNLIRLAPRSKLIPLAYFAFGELFFAEAIDDPSRNDLAKQAYEEVLKYPPADNPVYGDAQRRLEEIAARLGTSAAPAP